MTPTTRLKARALALGFDAVGVARVAPLGARARYEAWLAAGRHGDMRWLANAKHRERRAEPARLVAGIRSVLIQDGYRDAMAEEILQEAGVEVHLT